MFLEVNAAATLLVTALLGAMPTPFSFETDSTASSGSSADAQTGKHVSGTNSGDSTTLDAILHTPALPPSYESDGSTSADQSSSAGWTPPPGIPPWVEPVERCVASDDGRYAMNCTAARPAAPPTTADPAPGTPATPAVTIRDVATFRPELAVLTSEPDGWAVRGLDANFIATGGSSTRSGTLLGAAAEVHFTPIAWQFDYGDATEPRSTATPGATWQSLGLTEFDETATSHVYDTSGTYTVTLLVDYAAEYRLGATGPYIPIPGTLAIPSAPITLVVADSATTALVDRDCTAHPRGPGC